ncbi:hypothetical protein NC652_018642 [Populus alba x Populus x berolinensis]|nr:hypothetical protein NC652_018642 [Populus alba x Populus x berolinensis]
MTISVHTCHTVSLQLQSRTVDINASHYHMVPRVLWSAILLPVAITVRITWWFISLVDGFFSPIYAHFGAQSGHSGCSLYKGGSAIFSKQSVGSIVPPQPLAVGSSVLAQLLKYSDINKVKPVHWFYLCPSWLEILTVDMLILRLASSRCILHNHHSYKKTRRIHLSDNETLQKQPLSKCSQNERDPSESNMLLKDNKGKFRVTPPKARRPDIMGTSAPHPTKQTASCKGWRACLHLHLPGPFRGNEPLAAILSVSSSDVPTTKSLRSMILSKSSSLISFLHLEGAPVYPLPESTKEMKQDVLVINESHPALANHRCSVNNKSKFALLHHTEFSVF